MRIRRKWQPTPAKVRVPQPGHGLGWHLRRFLGSAGHMVGMLFAIGAIVMLNIGLTNGLIGLGLIPLLYATGYFFAERPRATSIGPMPAKDAPRIRAQLDELLAVIRMRVADDVYRSVQSIRDAVIFTLDHAGEQDQADPNVYLVRQTAIAYLPEALSNYIALPRIYAERQPIDGGRTSHDILLEQLYLMDVKVRRVAEEVLRRESQQLVAHSRFVTERYSDSSLDVGSHPPVSAPLNDSAKDHRSSRFH
ncbi:MAG TPA: hypothetical protein VEX62_00865 [Candidatus Limnocylindrales bacterium]|nr:hypothetical protein [Candidatus Limnocylindrales bacterium]